MAALASASVPAFKPDISAVLAGRHLSDAANTPIRPSASAPASASASKRDIRAVLAGQHLSDPAKIPRRRSEPLSAPSLAGNSLAGNSLAGNWRNGTNPACQIWGTTMVIGEDGNGKGTNAQGEVLWEGFIFRTGTHIEVDLQRRPQRKYRTTATLREDVLTIDAVEFVRVISGVPSAREQNRVEKLCEDLSKKWLDALSTMQYSKVAETYAQNAVLHIDIVGEQSLRSFAQMHALGCAGDAFVCRGRANIHEFWRRIVDSGVFDCRGLSAFDAANRCTTAVEGPTSGVLQSTFSSLGGAEGWIHARWIVHNQIRCDFLTISKSNILKDPPNLSVLAVNDHVINAGRALTDAQVREQLRPETEQFRIDFNNKNAKGCASAYGTDPYAIMRADVPAVSKLMKDTFNYDNPVLLWTRDEIELFWSRMINEVKLHSMRGYEQSGSDFPMTIAVVDDNVAFVKSKWRMNAVGGWIHAQRMVRTDQKTPWKVGTDFFAIYDTYN